MKTRNIVVLTVLGTVLVLAAIAGAFYLGGVAKQNNPTNNVSKTEYPYEFKQNMAAKCIADGGGHAPCNCSVDLMEKTYSYDEALQFDQNGVLPNEFRSLVRERCL